MDLPNAPSVLQRPDEKQRAGHDEPNVHRIPVPAPGAFHAVLFPKHQVVRGG
jgi:hypothetical protein